MPTIEVSEWVKEQLDKIKQERQHKSYDSVIRELLLKEKYFSEIDKRVGPLLDILLDFAKEDKELAIRLAEIMIFNRMECQA